MHNLADQDSVHALIDFIVFGRNPTENSYRVTCADALRSIMYSGNAQHMSVLCTVLIKLSMQASTVVCIKH